MDQPVHKSFRCSNEAETIAGASLALAPWRDRAARINSWFAGRQTRRDSRTRRRPAPDATLVGRTSPSPFSFPLCRGRDGSDDRGAPSMRAGTCCVSWHRHPGLPPDPTGLVDRRHGHIGTLLGRFRTCASPGREPAAWAVVASLMNPWRSRLTAIATRRPQAMFTNPLPLFAAVGSYPGVAADGRISRSPSGLKRMGGGWHRSALRTRNENKSRGQAVGRKERMRDQYVFLLIVGGCFALGLLSRLPSGELGKAEGVYVPPNS